jgi:DNA-binding MarR family transcriptional regulator
MGERPRASQQVRSETEPGRDLIRLNDFLPYRLVVLADRISRSLSGLYEKQFGLTRQEWRILAALADNGPMSSVDASRYTTLDAMAISRASSTLESKGYITREDSPSDRRVKIFRSTRSGSALYRRIMPLAIDRERHLTEGLSAEERACLEAVVSKLLERANTLGDVDPIKLKPLKDKGRSRDE